jgi:PKD repeat protein
LTITTAHTFTSAGTYNIKVMAEDKYGAQSIFSETLQVIIISNPPNKPNTPDGSIRGKPGVSYLYQTSTTDPDGDLLYYTWDWGDGTPINWTGPYNSAQTVAASHTWSTKGSYSVKVKAKDTTGAERVWSDPLPIMMPYSYTKSLPQFLELLLQRFPNAFPILQQLIRY